MSGKLIFLEKKMKVKYEIQELSWFKRRKLTKKELNNIQMKKEVLDIELEDFKKEKYHICKMHIKYEKENITLIGQVIFNEIKKNWLINGVDTKGNQLLIKILE